MKLKSLESIFLALQNAGARYLVVGGVAVIAHGYVRLTEDLDLVLDLSSSALPHSLQALASLGYRPLVPVSLLDFADANLRRDWVENRNMKVFNLVSDEYPDATIDIFPVEPFAFEAEYAAASWREIAPGLRARVVAVATLIALKEAANRPVDLIDIEKLRKLHPSS